MVRLSRTQLTSGDGIVDNLTHGNVKYASTLRRGMDAQALS